MKIAPESMYRYATVIGKDGSAQQRRIRVPHCHPDAKHKALGLCAKCVDERRSATRSRVRSAIRRAKLLPPVEGPKSTCEACGGLYVPLAHPDADPASYSRFCSSRCQSMHQALQPGNSWRALFPGATYQFMRDVPEQCQRCSGTLFDSEIGTSCVSCGRAFAVVERLVRAIFLGYDDAYALMRRENSLEVVKF